MLNLIIRKSKDAIPGWNGRSYIPLKTDYPQPSPKSILSQWSKNHLCRCGAQTHDPLFTCQVIPLYSYYSYLTLEMSASVVWKDNNFMRIFPICWNCKWRLKTCSSPSDVHRSFQNLGLLIVTLKKNILDINCDYNSKSTLPYVITFPSFCLIQLSIK